MRYIQSLIAVVVVSSAMTLMLNACSGNNEEQQAPVEAAGEQAHHYQCPMKCEGEKTYDEPGQCPKCEMDLQEIS